MQETPIPRHLTRHSMTRCADIQQSETTPSAAAVNRKGSGAAVLSLLCPKLHPLRSRIPELFRLAAPLCGVRTERSTIPYPLHREPLVRHPHDVEDYDLP